MTVQCKEITASDTELVRRLFLDYPFKKYQRRVQGLDTDAVANLLTEIHANRLNEDSIESIGVWDDGRLVAMGEIGYSKFHSDNYGIRFGKIHTFLSYIDPGVYSKILSDRLVETASRENFDLLTARVDTDEFKNIHILNDAGFYYVGTSTKLHLSCQGFHAERHRSSQPPISIDMYKDSYKDDILRIASTSHHTTHFHNDQNLPQEKTSELFNQWVGKFCRNGNENLFIVCVDDEIVGFALFLQSAMFEKQFSKKIRILDFIALRRDIQGQGIGYRFLRRLLTQLTPSLDIIELRTMANNYQALSLYQKLGFRIVSSDSVLHKTQNAKEG